MKYAYTDILIKKYEASIFSLQELQEMAEDGEDLEMKQSALETVELLQKGESPHFNEEHLKGE
jgi:hypothetical protein